MQTGRLLGRKVNALDAKATINERTKRRVNGAGGSCPRVGPQWKIVYGDTAPLSYGFAIKPNGVLGRLTALEARHTASRARTGRCSTATPSGPTS